MGKHVVAQRFDAVFAQAAMLAVFRVVIVNAVGGSG
jgi:hypothetical protein